MKKVLVLLSLPLVMSLNVCFADHSLEEQGKEVLKKFKSLRTEKRIDWKDDSAQNDYRDAEDEFNSLLDKIEKLEIAYNSISDGKVNNAFELLGAYQSALGGLVVGKTISGPILARKNIQFSVSVGVSGLVQKISEKLGIVVGAGGAVHVHQKDVRIVYGRARAEMLNALGNCAALVDGDPIADFRIRGAVTFLRNFQIMSQPECINIFGRTGAAFDFCR